MRTATKGWLIAATFLILLGALIFAIGMTAVGWDFTSLNTVSYEESVYEIDEAFNGISIQGDTEDVRILPAEDGLCRVIFLVAEYQRQIVEVRDGTLTVALEDTREWYDRLEVVFWSDTPDIVVYLPKDAYRLLSVELDTGDVEISQDFSFERVTIGVSTGDIYLENLSAGSLELTLSTGDAFLSNVTCATDLRLRTSTGDAIFSDVTCKNLISIGTTGDISLKNVIAEESVSLHRSTGDVLLELCDAATLSIETDTGDVIGTLCSDKRFAVHTTTGDIQVPDLTTGGICEVRTRTGDVRLSVK